MNPSRTSANAAANFLVVALRDGTRWLGSLVATWRAEAELRAMDARELRDLGLDRGGIAYAARRGRDEP